MRTAGGCLVAAACLAAFAACAKRALPARDDAGGLDPADTGVGGQTGTSCPAPRLELVGTPLLLLDSPPPIRGNLYTSLVWTGEEYLFVWRIFDGDAVLMQRIDASGQAVGGNIRLRPYENAFDVVWADSRLAAVWTRGVSAAGARRDVMFQTFDGLGRPLIDAVTLRSSAELGFDGGVSYGPRIAAFEGGLAVVWNEREIFVATVDVDGNLLQQPVAVGGSDLSSPEISVAATDGHILVGWSKRRILTSPEPALTSAVIARAFSASLTPLGGAMDLDDAGYSGSHQLLASASGFVALWSHGTLLTPVGAPEDIQVRIAHLPGAGTTATIGAIGAPVVGHYRGFAPAAWNRDHLVVLWDGGAGQNGVTLSRFAATGVRQGESLNLPTRAPAGRLYVAAHDGIVGFIWSEEVDGSYQVYFQQARSCP